MPRKSARAARRRKRARGDPPAGVRGALPPRARFGGHAGKPGEIPCRRPGGAASPLVARRGLARGFPATGTGAIRRGRGAGAFSFRRQLWVEQPSAQPLSHSVPGPPWRARLFDGSFGHNCLGRLLRPAKAARVQTRVAARCVGKQGARARPSARRNRRFRGQRRQVAPLVLADAPQVRAHLPFTPPRRQPSARRGGPRTVHLERRPHCLAQRPIGAVRSLRANCHSSPRVETLARR